MTFRDLDTLECIYHDKTIIPTTNILKRHENLLKQWELFLSFCKYQAKKGNLK